MHTDVVADAFVDDLSERRPQGTHVGSVADRLVSFRLQRARRRPAFEHVKPCWPATATGVGVQGSAKRSVMVSKYAVARRSTWSTVRSIAAPMSSPVTDVSAW